MKRNLIIAALLAVLIPGALLAQDEVTLESLAEALATLTGRVDGAEARIDALEAHHAATKIDGYCKLPDGLGSLDPEAATKWEELTGEETLNALRRGIEFNAEHQTVSYYYEERYDRDSYGLFVYYDSECNPTVGEWELLSD